MTQKQIELIRLMQESVNKARREMESEVKIANAKLATQLRNLRDLRETCDHVFPDGKSADDGGFMFGTCLICGAVDIGVT